MTFSIVARDPDTGAFGVATATAGPMVGALVPHTRRGFGAVATQAMTNPYLAVDALAALDREPAEAALAAALARDEHAGRRQVVIVDQAGRTAGWTGAECVGYAGHRLTDGVAVAGNMLAGEAVLADMLAAFESNRSTGLGRGLMAALLAGAAAGGDIRGLGSAALRIQGEQAYLETDLRVDAADDPLAALQALLRLDLEGSYADFFAGVPRR